MKKLLLLFLLSPALLQATLTRQARAYSYIAKAGQTVSADSEYNASQAATKAIDADYTTLWGTPNAAYPHWWKTDLGSTINHITFMQFLPTGQNWLWISAATINSSTDDSTWSSDLWSGGILALGGNYRYLLQGFDTNARYLRITGTAGNSSNQMGAREIWVGTGIPWVPKAENWRWGNADDGAWLTVDDSVAANSIYESSNSNSTVWLSYDFQTVTTFSGVEILTGIAGHEALHVDIYLSDDGTNWGSVFAHSDLAATASSQFVSLGSIVHKRYMKLNFTESTGTLTIPEIYLADDSTLGKTRKKSQVY